MGIAKSLLSPSSNRRSWPVAGCVGYSFFFCWMWNLYFGNYAEVQSGVSLHNIALMRIVMLVALLATLPCISRFADKLASSRGNSVSAIASAVLCPLSALAAFAFPCTCCDGGCGIDCFCSSVIIHFAAWGLSGIGYALFMAHWAWFDKALSAFDRRTAILIGILIASAAEFFLSSLLIPVATAIASVVLPIASIVLSLYARRAASGAKGKAGANSEEPEAPMRFSEMLSLEGKVSKNSLVLTFFSGVALGFCGFVIASILPGNACDIVLSGVMMIGGVALLVLVKAGKGLPLSRLMWLYVPLASYCLIPMCLFDDIVRALFACVLISALTAYSFVDLDLMIADFSSYSSSLVGVAARGRIGNVAGLIVGWAIAIAASLISGPDDDSLGKACLVVVLILIAATTIIFKDSAFRELPAMVEYSSEDVFAIRCAAIAEKHGLTKRQHEVFDLLARGRTAPSICEKLSISESTAKTHIYNIYQKLGIHTQRELIDLVESWVLVSDDVLRIKNTTDRSAR